MDTAVVIALPRAHQGFMGELKEEDEEGARGMLLFTSMDSASPPAILKRVVEGFHHDMGEVSDSCGDVIPDRNPIAHILVAPSCSSSLLDKGVPSSLLHVL